VIDRKIKTILVKNIKKKTWRHSRCKMGSPDLEEFAASCSQNLYGRCISMLCFPINKMVTPPMFHGGHSLQCVMSICWPQPSSHPLIRLFILPPSGFALATSKTHTTVEKSFSVPTISFNIVQTETRKTQQIITTQ
jgi:hypothetical protein